MKKLILVVIAIAVFVFTAETFAGVIIGRKVDNVLIAAEKGIIYFKIGKETIKYVIPSEGGIVAEGESEYTIFINKDGEKCHPYYILPIAVYGHLKKYIEFFPAPASSSGFCAEESAQEKIKKEKISNKTKKI